MKIPRVHINDRHIILNPKHKDQYYAFYQYLSPMVRETSAIHTLSGI